MVVVCVVEACVRLLWLQVHECSMHRQPLIWRQQQETAAAHHEV
jgi:hypothetical protein